MGFFRGDVFANWLYGLDRIRLAQSRDGRPPQAYGIMDTIRQSTAGGFLAITKAKANLKPCIFYRSIASTISESNCPPKLVLVVKTAS